MRQGVDYGLPFGKSTAVINMKGDLQLHQKSSFGVISSLPGTGGDQGGRGGDTHYNALDSCPVMAARRSYSTGAKVGAVFCDNATMQHVRSGIMV